MRLFICLLAVTFMANTSVKAQSPKVQEKAYTHKNLTVFLLEDNNRISQRYVTLEEAMKDNKITLHETGSVNELSVDNKSDNYVFIMAGDIVKGGKQDRTIGEDVVLRPQAKKVPLKSFCVEQSRWTKRGNEKVTEFSASTQTLSDKKLKIAARSSKSQSAVWKEVNDFQENAGKNINKNVKSSASATSLQLTLEDKDLRASVKEYLNALMPVIKGTNGTNIVGLAFCINGKISTVEWFGNSSLYNKLIPKILESAANEALSNYDPKAQYTQVGAGAISDFIRAAQHGKASSQKTGDRTLEKQYKTANSIMFESYYSTVSETTAIHVSIYSTDGVALDAQVNVTNQLPVRVRR